MRKADAQAATRSGRSPSSVGTMQPAVDEQVTRRKSSDGTAETSGELSVDSSAEPRVAPPPPMAEAPPPAAEAPPSAVETPLPQGAQAGSERASERASLDVAVRSDDPQAGSERASERAYLDVGVRSDDPLGAS